MNLFLLHLAVADAAMCVVAFPFATIAAFQNEWRFGSAACDWYGFIGFLTGNGSITMLAAISFDRYLHVWKPFSPFCMGSMRKVWIVSCSIWLYSITWSLCPIFGWSSYALEPHGTSCTVDWFSDGTGNLTFIVAMFVFVFFIPLIVMIFSYGSIMKWTRMRTKKFKESATITDSEKQQIKSERKIILMGVTMVSAFLFCWTPYAIVSFMGTLGLYDQYSIQWSAFAPVLAKSAVIVNPIIYCVTNQKFRSAYYKIIFCRSPTQVHP
ncbi:melanopsin-like [Tubulanus polymorphus]|uniref:melanopsin-like n=1 Tax=Tubulanus polymorphus TaxID=672921 RepID=UPI003DA5740A